MAKDDAQLENELVARILNNETLEQLRREDGRVVDRTLLPRIEKALAKMMEGSDYYNNKKIQELVAAYTIELERIRSEYVATEDEELLTGNERILHMGEPSRQTGGEPKVYRPDKR